MYVSCILFVQSMFRSGRRQDELAGYWLGSVAYSIFATVGSVHDERGARTRSTGAVHSQALLSH